MWLKSNALMLSNKGRICGFNVADIRLTQFTVHLRLTLVRSACRFVCSHNIACCDIRSNILVSETNTTLTKLIMIIEHSGRTCELYRRNRAQIRAS